jgi:hypothetical protein
MEAFRRRYPRGENYVVVSDLETPYERRFGPAVVRFVGLAGLIRALTTQGSLD